MALPSITSIVSVLFLAYMFNSLWSIGKLYFPPTCEEALGSNKVCYFSRVDIYNIMGVFAAAPLTYLNDILFKLFDL